MLECPDLVQGEVNSIDRHYYGMFGFLASKDEGLASPDKHMGNRDISLIERRESKIRLHFFMLILFRVPI